MEHKIVISGCSASRSGSDNNPTINWVSHLIKKYNYNIDQLAVEGQSNESITKKVYDYITKNNATNCIFLCQLTYTHRIGWWHQIANQWADYQPNYINGIPEIDEENDKVKFPYTININEKKSRYMFPKGNVSQSQYDELTKMYLTWLKYVYDEDEMFKALMFKIDLLQSYINETGNKIIFIYWPEIKDEFQYSELKKRNMFEVDNTISILNWSTKNNIVCPTTHLTDKGQLVFSEKLNGVLKEYGGAIKRDKQNSYI